jgi:hypothetical protein
VVELRESPPSVWTESFPPRPLATDEGSYSGPRFAEHGVGREKAVLLDEVHEKIGVLILRECHKRRQDGFAHHSVEITNDHNRITLSYRINLPGQEVEKLCSFFWVDSSRRVGAKEANISSTKMQVNA